MAAYLNLVVDQGSKTVHEVNVVDENNVAVNLTGCTARLQARKHFDSPTPFLTLTTENGGLSIPVGTDGKVVMTFAASTTQNLTDYTGVYDLEIVFSDGEPRRIMQGQIQIKREVTR